MGGFQKSEEIYASQLKTGNLTLIDELAKQAFKRPTDNYRLQGETLQRWSASMESMNEFLFKPKEDIKRIQLSIISNLVDKAYKNVPFYRELYGACGYIEGGISSFSDFEQLPIVSKSLLNSFDDSIRVSDPGAIESAHTARTSGSSGKPFSVYRDDDYIVLEHLHLMRFYNACLQQPLQPHDWIYMIHHAGLAFSSLHGKYRTFQLPDLLSNTPLGEHLLFLRPKVVVTLPSYLPIILRHKSEFVMSGVEAILTNSESSTQLERAYYSKALGVPIFDEYSSEEIGMIATQCSHGQYHVAEDNVYLEIVNEDEQGFGNVICTGLSNELMPLIRYDHGDVAKGIQNQTRCDCGSFCTSLKEVNGRRDDAFRTHEHKLVPSASLLAAVDDILLATDRTLQAFRLVQKSSDTIELLTKYNGETNRNMPTMLEQLKIRFSSLFGYTVNLLHQEVGALPEQKSYKRRSIVREWELD
ncbi:phenylacetate--CoA ligase family protein [Pseudomonas sp. GW101-3H06]|uniref:phenylacetate--CoA ligase family protein n=1 Tax=Pseudomonas sp. GW101-3H06 TaxID=2751347 RepID=UPI001A939150|nr:phenylacetate--CoA ligase family protein [Pseudomonas sp. GW101-3H06]